MRNLRTEAIVVKRHNIGEADRLITVITPHFGKMTIKATGVRKITSRRSAHIELLNFCSLSLYKGNGMHVLTEAKMLDDFSPIKKDFTKVGIAYHLCELIDGLCPENQDNTNVFYLLKKTLQKISGQEFIAEKPKAVPLAIDDFTLGTYGLEEEKKDVNFIAQSTETIASALHTFELALLSELGYWDRNDAKSFSFDTQAMIENIMERKLKSRQLFAKLQ